LNYIIGAIDQQKRDRIEVLLSAFTILPFSSEISQEAANSELERIYFLWLVDKKTTQIKPNHRCSFFLHPSHLKKWELDISSVYHNFKFETFCF